MPAYPVDIGEWPAGIPRLEDLDPNERAQVEAALDGKS